MVFTNYVNLIFSTLGICVNLLFIIILSSKNEMLKNKMYQHLLINAYFNLAFSIVLTLNFALKRLEENSIQFSLFYLTIYSQYIHLVLAKVFVNVFRTASNLSYMAFTLSRFISTTNAKNRYLIKFQELNAKKCIFLILTISLLVNVHVYFQFKIKFAEENKEQVNQ